MTTDRRNVTPGSEVSGAKTWPDSTPLEPESQELERYRLMRLCPCEACQTTGHAADGSRCKECRGEGRQLEEVATCPTPESVGVAIVTLSREGEWDDGCGFGLIDSLGEKGRKWLVLPFRPSPRNVSDAGRVLGGSRSSATSGAKNRRPS